MPADDELVLQRSADHSIRIYLSGPPAAPAVLLLHGGPGGGANLQHRTDFDLQRVRLIQFDQRGTGRSAWTDPLVDNTTDEQIADIEAIREALGLESWLVVGGSWGALLATLYAERHPERVRALVLRNVFMDRLEDQQWLLRDDGPAPHAHGRVRELLEDEAPFTGLSRVVNADDDRSRHAASAWLHYERVLSGVARDGGPMVPVTEQQLSDVQIELHYLANDFFVEQNQAAAGVTALDDVPGVVLQGEADAVISPDSADHLTADWDAGEVRRVPGGEHSLRSPAMARAWAEAISETADHFGGPGTTDA